MTKRQILVITVFLSNIALITSLSADTVEFFRDDYIIQEQSTKITNKLHDAATTFLIDKGLNANVAQERIMKSLLHSKTEAHALAQKIMEQKGISYEEIVRYVASEALYNKRVDLSSKTEIVALLQRSRKNHSV